MKLAGEKTFLEEEGGEGEGRGGGGGGRATLLETVVLEETHKVSWGQVEEDVLEVEHNSKPEATLQVATLKDDGKQNANGIIG